MTRIIIFIALLACSVLMASCVDMKQERPKKQQTQPAWQYSHL